MRGRGPGCPDRGTTLGPSRAGHLRAELGAERVDRAAPSVIVDAAHPDDGDDIEAFDVAGATDVHLLGTEAATTAATVLGDDFREQWAAPEAQPRVCT